MAEGGQCWAAGRRITCLQSEVEGAGWAAPEEEAKRPADRRQASRRLDTEAISVSTGVGVLSLHLRNCFSMAL